MNEEVKDTTYEPKFENYKQKQKYYAEKYKNRGNVFFSQQGAGELFVEGKVGTIKPKKGRTYRKEK